MTAEKNYFICRNENCKTETNSSGDSVSGGKVFNYAQPKKGQGYSCPHCGSKYKEENGNVLLVFEKEVIIEGSKGFSDFKTQYETNRIHFKKLILRNINEPDYKGNILSFNKCHIDELVIENVHIISAFYPVVFSNCHIDKISISNTKISKAELNSYKSLWNFFGLVFFQTTITKSFVTNNSETKIIISGCEVKCSLDFSKNSKVGLALIHNEHDPKIKADKNSVVKPLFEVTDRAPAVKEKKIKTSGKIISNIDIDELHVDPDVIKLSVLKNCTIHKLVFEEGTDIKGRLEFKNCVIENMQNQPSCFEKDLVFLGCTFSCEFILKRLSFKKSLVFELCTFKTNSMFNELKIEEDLYLNYSVFKKGLSVSGVRCGGYVKCEINTIQNIINFEDNVVAKDVNLSFINSADSIVLFHNEINGYLFLTQITTKGKLDINMLNGEALTIDDIAIDASVEINNLVLKNDLKITRMVVSDDANFFFTKIEGSLFLFRSSFKKDFLAYDLESKLNMFMNNDFKGNGSFNSCTFRQQTWTSRNLFHDSLNWTSIHAYNTSFNDNYLFGSFTIDKTEAKDIIMDHNFTGQDIEINNSKVNDITVNDNVSEQKFNFKYLKSFDIAVNNNTANQDFEVFDIKANNFNFNDNKIGQGFSMSKSELTDIKFFDNQLNDDLLINNSRVKDIFINNNTSKKGFKLSYLLAFDIEINNNSARQNFEILEMKANNFSFNDNKIKKEFSLKNSELKDAKFYDNLVNEDFVMNDSITRDIYLVRNQTDKELVLNYATSNDLLFTGNDVPLVRFLNSFFAEITLSECKKVETALFDDISASKNIKITGNAFLKDLSLNKCKSEGDLHLTDNKIGENLIINNSTTNDIYLDRNQVKKELRLNYATSNDVLFTGNDVPLVRFLNSFFAEINISECKNVENAIFVNVTATSNFNTHNNIFSGDLFMKSCKVQKNIDFNHNRFQESFEIDDLKVNNITFNVNEIKKKFSVKNTETNNLQINANKFHESYEINVLKADDLYFFNNHVEAGLNIFNAEINDLIFTRNNAKELRVYNGNYAAITISECKIIGEATLYNISASKDVKITENTFLKNLSIEKCKSDGDLLLNNNKIEKGFSLEISDLYDNIFYNSLKKTQLTVDYSFKGFSLKDSKLNNINFYDNLINNDFKINNSTTRDIYLVRNQVKKELLLNYATSNDLLFIGNDVPFVSFFNCSFANISISECKRIGEAILNSISASKDVKITENAFVHGISFNKFVSDGDLQFNDNKIGENLIINNSKVNDIYINDSVTEQSFKINYTRAFDITINKNKANQNFEIIDTTANNINFNNNEIGVDFILNKSELNDTRFNENYVNENLIINNSTTNDIYLEKNQVKKELRLNYATSNDVLFTGNDVPLVRFLNSFFAEINISECKNVENAIFVNVTANSNIKIHDNVFGGDLYLKLCTVIKNIELTKNEVQHLDILNTASNDILFENNRVKNTLYINDTKADDIILKSNEVAVQVMQTEETETTDEEASSKRSRGVFLETCTIESELTIKSNKTSESLQINETLADKLSFFANKTKLFKIRNGRYRKVGIYYCMEIESFNCNNITVSKDITLSNNVFQDDFDMLYCKIENDLEMINNQFNGYHRLNNNTVLGSLIYKTVSVEEGVKISTSFMNTIIYHNKFNFVSFENTRFKSTFYFDNNTVQSSLKMGVRNLSDNDTSISFPKAVSITENKIANAMFFNLNFLSPLCLHHNNFDGDIALRNISHKNTIDFTGCYVGGTFAFSNTSKSEEDGDLILDNIFIDKRISFTNYLPASFSFINATFNGFEIPANWKMQKKELINNNAPTRREVEAGPPPGKRNFMKKRWDYFAKDKVVYVLKENILQKGKNEDADLPYNLIKSHYESDSYFNMIPMMWKFLQADIFSKEKKKEILINIKGGKDLLHAKYFIDQCVNKTFYPVYYGFFGKEIMEHIALLAKHFAEIEHTSEEEQVIVTISLLKVFFERFSKAMKLFENHIIYGESGDKKKDKRIYKREINKSLEEQYHVLRHIYGSNGELKEEDSAYYMWMHYKNINEMHSAPLGTKPKYWMKYILYERIFGWGVDLVRILKNTGWLVLVFAAIYKVMFWINPGLKINWDGRELYGSDIGPFKPIVLALQTTFSAILGDWAPIGAGWIKIPMTINAVLGILFVTFLIGAYGRKMLR